MPSALRSRGATGRSGEAALQQYIAWANSYARLERARELELARRFRESGDRAAGDELARSHLRYSLAVALKYRGYGLPVLELVAEGNAGIAVALTRFEPERGLRFVTYASYWIRACIIDYILRFKSVVGGGLGALRSRTFFTLRRERARILSRLGDGEEAERQLAERMNVSREQLAGMLARLDSHDLPLDSPELERSASPTLVTTAAQDELLDDRVRRSRVQAAVRQALSGLDERDRFISEHRLMAMPEDELSLAEVVRRLGVSRERARQLEARVKRRLRERITGICRDAGQDWIDAA